MPYSVSKSSECSASKPWAVLKEDGTVMGCHATKAAATEQQKALYANEPELAAKYESIDFTPPQGVRDEAEKGLAWRREFGRGGTGVGIARARDLSNGVKISPDTAKRMKAYFDRHEVDKQGEGFSLGEDGFPSNGRIAWALWGGDAGQSWANKLVRQMNAEDNAKAFKAEASANEIKLYGPIGYPGITAADFKNRLEAADKSLPLVIRIDSEGGSVFDGMSIYDAITAWPAGSKAIVESAAFSIASFIPMAADTVEITENGYVMLHNPYTMTEGDGNDHEKMSELLKKLQSSMIAAYSERTGRSEEEIKQIMNAETWYTASEARDAGLVDRILSTKKTSRVIESRGNLPQRVLASLKVSGDPSGDGVVPLGDSEMATEKIAATAKSIKARYGKVASPEFIVKALEEEKSMDDVGEMLLEELMSKMDEMSAKMSAMEEEMNGYKAQLEAAKAEEHVMPMEEEKPAMRARGVQVVRSAPVQSFKNAAQQWKDAVEKHVKSGIDKASAVRRANKENPGLRAAMLSESGIR